MTSPRRIRSAALALTAGGLLLAACGGGQGEDGDSSNASESTCVEPAEPGAPAQVGTVAEGAFADSTVTFASWGSTFQEAQMAALACFAETSGATLIEDAAEYAKVVAGVEAGSPANDIVNVDSNWGIQNCGTLFESIDLDIVDVSQVPDGMVDECTVPAMEYGYLFVYNTEVYGDNPPETWADFFDTEAFPGKRALQGFPDQSPGLFEAALLGDGVSMDDMYPIDFDRALAKYDTIRDDLIFWGSGTDAQTMMETGEASMGLIWSGRAASAAENGAPIEAIWDQSIKLMDVLVVPKGTPNKDAAMAALNYYLGEQSQTILAEGAPGNSPVNVNSRPMIEGPASGFITTSPEAAEVILHPDFTWWSENSNEAAEAFGNWLNS